jgi:DNA invertase Pin-like site-specific DNA recombinase
VSSRAQDLNAQLAALQAAGCEHIYSVKLSGKDAQRPRLQALLHKVIPGDVIVVTKLERFARSLANLLSMLAELGETNVGFRSLGDPIDTTTPQGRLVLHVFAALAEFERELIKERRDAGRARAIADGVRFGPKPTLSWAPTRTGRLSETRMRDANDLFHAPSIRYADTVSS